MVETDLRSFKIVLAKGSSCHPEWIMHKRNFRDNDYSSSLQGY